MSYKKRVWPLIIGLPLCVYAFLLGRLIFPVSIEFVCWTIYCFICYIIILRQAYKKRDDFRIIAIGVPIVVVVFLLVEYFFRGFLNIFAIGCALCWLCIFILKLLKKTARGLGSLIFNIPGLIDTFVRNIRTYIVSSTKQKAKVSKDNSYKYNSDEELRIASDINAKLSSIEEIIKKLKTN